MIREWISQHNFDIVGLSECNVHWKNVPADQRLPERTLGWFETLHLSLAYMESWVRSTAYQVGGVLLWSINKGAHRIIKHGIDPSQMGRWCWTQYRGKNGTTLRVISGYRCVENIAGVLSAWSQQTLHLERLNCGVDPRHKFTQDLLSELTTWMEQGDQIVLGLDLNENVFTAEFTKLIKELGLMELNIHRHDKLPNTYIHGSNTIDALYVTSALADSSCGYLPFLGDHRPLWIDIPLDLVFGTTTITPPRARRLKLQDPRIVDRYTTALSQYIKDHQIRERLQILSQRTDFYSSTYVMEYNNIDRLRTAGMHQAEKQCRKLRMGEVPFTPEYSRISNSVLIWRLICQLKSGKKIDSRYFNRQLKRIDFPRNRIQQMTLEEAQAQRRAAYKILNDYSKTASTKRSTWMEELAAARANISGLTSEQELLALIHRERQRKEARLIKFTLKAQSSVGLSMIQVSQNGAIQEIMDKEQMEQGLMSELSVRFHQASTTPFASLPLLRLIGNLGISAHSRHILEGTFQCPPEVDIWTKKLISHLQFVPQALTIQRQFSLSLSEDDHTDGWKKMKERTSPGYSSLSFAQFKAAAGDEDLRFCDSILAEIPYRTGLSPDRWQKGVDVMLQKQQGNFKVEKLRAILLYEADFNQNNKRYGRQLMDLAEKYNALAVEQFGSRKHRSAIDQSLNKSLTYDLWRQQKTPGALCSNDAKSCYDRIIHSFASLCLQRLGSPTEPIISMFSTIQKLDHHIRTIHGTSSTSFSGRNWESPIHGVGQGNGAGPQIWAAVSTPLLNMLQAEGCGSFLKSAMTSDKVHFVGYAFVDDTDLIASSYNNQSGNQVFHDIQLSLTAWQGGLHASGGAIVPEKSHWYFIDFHWNGDKPAYKKADKAPGKLQVRDHTGRMQSLKQLQPWEALKTLGVYLAPDGNMKVQVEHMRNQAVEWSDRIRAGHLSRQSVTQALLTTIFKSLEYPLPVTTLTQAECEYITSPILQHCLPRMGIVRSFPRTLVHSHAQFQGLQIPNLYWLQGYYHIERLLKFYGSRQLSGSLLRHSLESLRLELGCNGSLMELPYDTFGGLATPSWVVHTWSFLITHHLRLELSVPELALHRKNDALLIPLFVAQGYRGSELRQLNLCRMYLKVTSLSDICLGCGTQISKLSWNGLPDFTRKQLYHWPQHPSPHYSAWEVWRKALSKICSGPRFLLQPLGNWLGKTGTLYFFEESTDRIYLQSGVGCFYFRKMPGRPSRRSIARFGGKIACNDIPCTAVPATVEYHHSYLYLSGWDSVFPLPGPPTASTFFQYLQEIIPANCLWVIQDLQFIGSFSNFENTCALKTISLRAVSDGSFKDLHGTASWRISEITSSDYFLGSTISPGAPSCQSAYRSELTGLYGICITLWAIWKHYDCHINVEIGCDGLSALNMCKIDDDTISPNILHSDLIYSVRYLLRQITGNVTWRFIKGHQDTGPDQVLDIWAQFNIQMDAEAKQYWTRTYDIPLNERPQTVFKEPGALWIQNEKIVANLKERLILFLSSTKGIKYWEDKFRIEEGQGDKINWQMIGSARKGIPRSRQIWISKTTSGFFGTGKMMLRWKLRNSASCPRCSAEVEDTLHIIQCPDTAATSLWDSRLTEFKYWLIETHTTPLLAQSICQRLQNWRSNSEFLALPLSLSPEMSDAIHDQDFLGWDKFLLGFWSKQWEGAQERYLQSIQSKTTIKRWITAIIRKLWDIIWDMWEHRNEKLHHSEQGEIVAQLNNDISHEYQHGCTNLSKSGKALFKRPLGMLLMSSIPQKQLWLQRVQSARTQLLRRQAAGNQAYMNERNLMRQWMGTTDR